jgi:hypothetical protein
MKVARPGAAVAVLFVVTVPAGLVVLSVGSGPAGADLLCLDKVGNFVPCGQPTTPTVAPPSTLPPTTAPPPLPASPPPPVVANPPVDVALPDFDHSSPHPAGSTGPGLAGPIAVVDAALVILLAFAVLVRRRAAAVNA